MQTQMINLSIPKPLLEALDIQAKKEVKTRSELMRDAVRSYITRNRQLADISAYGKKQAKKRGIKPEDVEELIDDYRLGK